MKFLLLSDLNDKNIIKMIDDLFIFFIFPCLAAHRSDGIYGPLIIRQKNTSDVHHDKYDLDMPYHTIMVSYSVINMNYLIALNY